MNINENFNDIQNSEKTELVAEIRYYLFFWPWFVFSIIVLIVSAFIFLRYSSTIYTTTAQLQVKDSQSDPSTFLSRSASAMFSFDRVKIDNHIAQITSIPNYIKLVEKLDLQTQIYEVGRIKNTLKFQDEIPFIINFKNDNIYKDGILLRISGANSSVDVLDKSYSFDIKNNYFECDEFSLNFNKIIKEDIDYLIRRFDKKLIVSSVEESIEVNPSTLEGDNIDLSIKGSNIMRNE